MLNGNCPLPHHQKNHQAIDHHVTNHQKNHHAIDHRNMPPNWHKLCTRTCFLNIKRTEHSLTRLYVPIYPKKVIGTHIEWKKAEELTYPSKNIGLEEITIFLMASHPSVNMPYSHLLRTQAFAVVFANIKLVECAWPLKLFCWLFTSREFSLSKTAANSISIYNSSSFFFSFWSLKIFSPFLLRSFFFLFCRYFLSPLSSRFHKQTNKQNNNDNRLTNMAPLS